MVRRKSEKEQNEILVDNFSIVSGTLKDSNKKILKFEMETSVGTVSMYLDTMDVESVLSAILVHLAECEDSDVEIVDDDFQDEPKPNPKSRRRKHTTN